MLSSMATLRVNEEYGGSETHAFASGFSNKRTPSLTALPDELLIGILLQT
jgi:hypothetical protein